MLCYIADMETIMTLIRFGGKWTDRYQYDEYTMTGLIIPTICSLNNLVHLVKNEIKCNMQNIELCYQLSPGMPPIKLLTDN